MKFKFRLQSIMEVRKTEVDLAQRDFHEAKSRETKEENRLLSMKELITQAIQSRYDIQKAGGVVGENLQSIQTFIRGQKIRVQTQEKILNGLQKITEDKRLILVEAMKNLKTLETLREKRLDDFKRALKKREIKQLDELIVMGHGRRGIP